MLRKLIARIKESRSQRQAARAVARAREEEVLAAVEHVVDEVNPKLRAIGSCRTGPRLLRGSCGQHTRSG